MRGKNHKKANLLLAFLFSFLYLYFTKNLAFEPLLKFWYGALWGPFILVCSVAVPLHYAGVEIWKEAVTGMVCMIESHIVTDKVF